MDATLPFDVQLLRRYDCPGPRYTSYPTASQFSEDFGEAELRQHVQHSNSDPIPRELSLYVHLPFGDRTKGRPYVERLVREIGLTAGLFDRDRDVLQLHLGGGAANLLSSTELGELVDSLERHFHFSSGPERGFSIELDRIQCVEETLRAIDQYRASGFRSINVDLIYGLPNQDLAGFACTLDGILSVRPNRLAVYGYAHPPDIHKPQRQFETVDLPSVELRHGLLRLAIEKLSAAGYHHVGMDQFALPEDSLVRARASGTLRRNLLGYTTHADCDLVGFGVGAISHIGDSFSQSLRDLPGWEHALDEGRLPIWRGMALDEDDVLRADAIQQLMCLGEIEVSRLESRYDVEFARYFADALEKLRPLAADGLVTVEPGRIAVTRRGRLLMRIIVMCFDRYLTPVGGRDDNRHPSLTQSHRRRWR